MDRSESLAAQLVEESPDALLALDLDGVVLSWNGGATRIFGYGRAEALGRTIEQLVVPEEHRAEVRAVFADAARGVAVAFEAVRQRKDGTFIRVAVNIRRVDPPGAEPYLAGSAKDVTELRRLQAREAREALSLLEASPDALVIVGPDGLIQRVNRQAEVMFGYPREELVGATIERLVPERMRDQHRGLRGGYATSPHSRPLGVGRTLRAVRKDGSEFEAEISLAPLATEQGVQVSAFIRDVTRRRRAEDKFRGFLESTPDAIVISNAAGTIELVNAQAEKLFGYPRAELLGRSVELLVPVRFRNAHAAHCQGFMAAPQARSMGGRRELFALRRDGSELPVEVSLSPLDTEDGPMVASAIRDVTERKQLEVRMQESNRLKSEFLANMSHELRTPLNAIIGFSELMHRGKVGALAPQHQEYLGDILTSARHLLQLINDVLDLAKVEAGRMEFRPERVNLEQILGEVRDILRGLAASKRLRIETVVDPRVAIAVVDPARMRQILYNYLSNAIKFTPEEGRITLRISAAEPDFFRLDVEDSGIGIPAEKFDQLFMEFRQLDASTAKRYQGTGLGLVLTKKICESQGGRVEVKSVVGHGSTFSAILPRGLGGGR